MQLTRGASVASGLRRTRHPLVPLAADRECSTGYKVRFLGLAFVLLLVALFPNRGEACSCLPQTVRQQFEEAQVVFVGKLVSAVPHPTDACGDESLTFVVGEAFKGAEKGHRVVVKNGSTGRQRDGSLPPANAAVCLAACPSFAEQGRDYLVFATGEPLEFSCSGPMRTSSRYFKKDRAELRTLARR